MSPPHARRNLGWSSRHAAPERAFLTRSRSTPRRALDRAIETCEPHPLRLVGSRIARCTPACGGGRRRVDQPLSPSYVRQVTPRELLMRVWQGFYTSYRSLCGAAALQLVVANSAVAQRQMSSPRFDQQLAPLHVIDATMIDTTANACGDFFQFANGAWLARDTIPAAYSYSGVSRDMADRNELVVRSVLDEAMANRSSPSTISTQRKLGTFYASCMDSIGAEAKGATTLRPLLSRIDGITTRTQLLAQIADVQLNGGNALFAYAPSADPHDAAHYMVWLVQSGLGLPDRDYYTDQGSSADSLRSAYIDHIAKTLTLAGEDPVAAASDAARIMALETELAKASTRRVDLRDPAATDHPMPLAQLSALAPNVDWPGYSRSIGMTASVTRVNVA